MLQIEQLLFSDVSAGLHLEAIMKTPEWQQRRSNLKALKSISKMERLDKSGAPLERPKKLDHRRKKCSRLIKPTTSEPVTTSKLFDVFSHDSMAFNIHHYLYINVEKSIYWPIKMTCNCPSKELFLVGSHICYNIIYELCRFMT